MGTSLDSRKIGRARWRQLRNGSAIIYKPAGNNRVSERSRGIRRAVGHL
jgi:hypothetical protein